MWLSIWPSLMFKGGALMKQLVGRPLLDWNEMHVVPKRRKRCSCLFSVKTLFSHAEEIWRYIKRNLKYLCIFRINDLRASSTLSLYFSASVLNVCAAFSTWICWKRLECNKACNMLSSLQLPPSAPPALALQSHWTQSHCCQSVVVALFKNKQEISCV